MIGPQIPLVAPTTSESLDKAKRAADLQATIAAQLRNAGLANAAQGGDQPVAAATDAQCVYNS